MCCARHHVRTHNGRTKYEAPSHRLLPLCRLPGGEQRSRFLATGDLATLICALSPVKRGASIDRLLGELIASVHRAWRYNKQNNDREHAWVTRPIAIRRSRVRPYLPASAPTAAIVSTSSR